MDGKEKTARAAASWGDDAPSGKFAGRLLRLPFTAIAALLGESERKGAADVEYRSEKSA